MSLEFKFEQFLDRRKRSNIFQYEISEDFHVKDRQRKYSKNGLDKAYERIFKCENIESITGSLQFLWKSVERTKRTYFLVDGKRVVGRKKCI
jgi:hypothetical protein